MSWDDEVLAHGDFTVVREGMWQVSGQLPRMALPRNMAVARLADGGLWIHSAVALRESAMKELERLGEPKWLVVPSQFHTIDLKRFKTRYPSIRVVAPAAVRAAIEKKTGVHVDASVEEALPPVGVKVHAPAGLKAVERVFEVEGALVFCDALFNVKEHLPGFSGFLMRVIGSTGYFGMTRIGRTFVAADARAFGRWLRDEAAKLPGVEAILVAHGDAITGADACKAALESAAARLV
jgi:hypothetical protein